MSSPTSIPTGGDSDVPIGALSDIPKTFISEPPLRESEEEENIGEKNHNGVRLQSDEPLNVIVPTIHRGIKMMDTTLSGFSFLNTICNMFGITPLGAVTMLFIILVILIRTNILNLILFGVGMIYPLYMSYMALSNPGPSIEEYARWLKYWVLYAILSILGLTTIHDNDGILIAIIKFMLVISILFFSESIYRYTIMQYGNVHRDRIQQGVDKTKKYLMKAFSSRDSNFERNPITSHHHNRPFFAPAPGITPLNYPPQHFEGDDGTNEKSYEPPWSHSRRGPELRRGGPPPPPSRRFLPGQRSWHFPSAPSPTHPPSEMNHPSVPMRKHVNDRRNRFVN